MKKNIRKCMIFAIVAVIALCCGVLSGCGNKGEAVKNVDCDGFAIMWECAAKDAYFGVSINGGEEKIVYDKIIDFDTQNKDFSVTITTLHKSFGKEKRYESVTKDFKALGELKALKFDASGALSWQEVSGASGYIVACEKAGAVTLTPVSANSFSDFDPEGGAMSFKVRPVNNEANGNFYGTFCKSVSALFMSTPKNVVFNSDNETITWDAVAGASNYTVSINGVEQVATQSRINSFTPTSDIDIKIKANGAGNTQPSRFSQSKKYTYLAPIVTFNVEDGVLIWSANEKATAYKIMINGIVRDELLHEARYNIPVSSQVKVQIKPIIEDSDSFSSWSNSQTLLILATPTMQLQQGILTWQTVQGAGGYKLRVNKDGGESSVIDLGAAALSSDFAFTDVGVYECTLTAMTDSQNCFASRKSQTVTVTRLPAPTSSTITDNPYKTDDTYLSFTPVTNAQGYSVTYNGTNFVSDLNAVRVKITGVFDTSSLDEQKVTLGVVAKGTPSESGMVVYLPSKPLNTNITKLATPKNVRISESKIVFDTVTGASAYALYLDGAGTDNATDLSASGETFSVNISAGDHTLALRAKGNGSNIVSSNISHGDNNKPFAFHKLAAPTITIANKILSWQTNDDKAASISVFLDGQPSIAEATNGTDVSKHVKVGFGTEFHVVANGNGATVLSSAASNVLTAQKLAAPQNFRLTATQIIWDTVANSLGYNLYNGNSVIASPTSTAYETAFLEATDYNMSVMAKGDNSRYFDSDKSNTKTFTKLAAPTITSPNGGAFKWSLIPKASGYDIKVGANAVMHLEATVAEYAPNFTIAGKIKTTFRTIGNNETTISSDPVEVETLVQQLAKPTLTVTKTAKGEILADATDNDYAAYGEFITFTHYSNNGNPNAGAIKNWGSAAGKYNLKVKVNGQFFFSNVYYMSSNDSLVSSITILAAPTDIESAQDITTKDYAMTWKTVSGATYSLKLIFIDAGGTTVNTLDNITNNTGTYDLGKKGGDTIKTAVTIKYELRAIGKDNVWSSALSVGTLTL